MISNARVYDLIYLACREIGIVSLGDTVDSSITQEALLILNGLRAENSIAQKNYKIYDETYAVPAQTLNVTLGTAGPTVGNFPTRPNRITQVVIMSGVPGPSINYPLEILPYEEYRALALTNVYGVPQRCYLDTSYPIQNLWFYPGLSSGWSVRVMGTSYMSEYENVGEQYIDPPEYFSALYLELALRLATKYGVDASQSTIIQARGAMKSVKANLFMMRAKKMPNNLKTPEGSFNIYAGM